MKFRASEMPRVVKCPGSKITQQAYPGTSGREAAEGSVAHKVAATVLTTDAPLSSFLNKSINNIYIDQEMLFYLQLYINECEIPGMVEQALGLNHEEHTLTGTPDYRRYANDTRTLHIKDLKYGYGWVEAFENWQLLSYAILSPLPVECERVELTIIQPRASHPEGPVRTWVLGVGALRSYRNFIFGAMSDASLAEPPVKTGSHCRYCRGLVNCHAATAAAGYALDYAGTAGHSGITPEEIALRLGVTQRAIEILTHGAAALEESGLAMCKAGKIIPGWEARSTMSPLAWDIDPIPIGDAMNVNLRAPEKAITPTQAVSRKLIAEATIKSLASRKTGGVKLKRVDHTRAKRILS